MPTLVPEAEFLAVYEEWLRGRLTQKEAAARLEVSERTFRRYVARFREHGSRWWTDRSRPRPSHRRAPAEERAALEALYSDRYAGWSVRHFHERYRSEHGGARSYGWVKDSLQAAGLVARRSRDGASRRVRRQKREAAGRAAREGMLIHQVASRGAWVAGRTWDLVLTVDDATNRVHSGFFAEERGIWSVFRGLRETLCGSGLFARLSPGLSLPEPLTAAETAFGGGSRAQLERAMAELDIGTLPPERRRRARPMRMISTLRGRLPQELATEGIAGLEAANGFLPRFWTGFNESMAVRARDATGAFVPLDAQGLAALSDVLCLKHEATVQRGERLLVNGAELEIPAHARRCLDPDKQYRLHEYEDGSCALFSGCERVTAIEPAGAGADR